MVNFSASNPIGRKFPKTRKDKRKQMSNKTIKMVAAAALFAAGAAFAQEAAPAAETALDGWSYTPGEGVSFDEQPIFSAEFALNFDSKYMTYGVVDGKDPILTPTAYGTFFDLVYFGVEAIFDTTKGNGKRGGYGNRAGKYTTLDAVVGAAYDFDLGETLGALSVDFNYIYEYIPTQRHAGDGCPDTQYLNLELSLGDLWLEPTFAVERDLMLDDGTYFNFSIGHTFTVVGDDEDQVVTFRPSVGQGFGNKSRNKAYLGKEKEGFMDTTLKGELEWAICDNLSLGAYVAVSEYLFDRRLRDGARDHNTEWGKSEDHSWNVWGGLSLTATF